MRIEDRNNKFVYIFFLETKEDMQRIKISTICKKLKRK